jgi:hypothetical protein
MTDSDLFRDDEDRSRFEERVRRDQARRINGQPDNRGLPTVRVVCAGRPEKATTHKLLDVAVFSTRPFDPDLGEWANWFWNRDLAVGGGRIHSTTRIREDLAKRQVTDAEVEAGWRPGLTEVTPKRHVGSADIGSTLHLKCAKCPNEGRMRAEFVTRVLDMFVVAPESVPAHLAPFLLLARRQVTLNALILLNTRPEFAAFRSSS